MNTRVPQGVRADSPQSYRSLERIGAVVRGLMKLDCVDPIEALDFFEDLHEVSVETPTHGTVPLCSAVEEVSGTEGYAIFDSALRGIRMVASTTAYEWLERNHPRGTYFFTHELGHCFLHTDQLIRLAKLPEHQQAAFHRGSANHEMYEDTEWQANGFASALLMPAAGLAKLEAARCRLSVESIVSVFKVSREAATYRLRNYLKRRGELLDLRA